MSDANRAAAIAEVERVLKDIGLLEFAGEVQLLEWAKSTSRDGPKVKLLLPDDESIEPFQRATVRKGGQAGQLYYLMAIALDEPTAPPPILAERLPPPPKPMPNELASSLHKRRYWHNPVLWRRMAAEGIYVQSEHKAWIETQPCYGGIHHRTSGEERLALGSVMCSGDVCLHHCHGAEVPAAGSSTKNPQKPPHWYGLPFCHAHHTWVHNSHGPTREGKRLLLEAAVQITADRMKERMKAHLGIESMRAITPAMLEDFERAIGL